MPLKDKYLRYTPEITLEIFTLVCNKLIENGINPSHGESTATKYYNFSKTENYLQLNGDGSCFECYEKNYGLNETTVQEVLGYDPFVKKEVIPEYVECIVQLCAFDLGKIYKTAKCLESYRVLCSDGGGQMIEGFEDKFKPSTKEAFDAQFKPKEKLKQAVHCKTQEEWDFVTEKCNFHWNTNNFPKTKENCIVIDNNSWDSITQLNRLGGYQILSFQEWCQQNGYEMKNEVKFEVGKWYKSNFSGLIYYLKYDKTIPLEKYNKIYYSILIKGRKIVKNDYIANKELENSFTLLTNLSEIQQYLPEGHPDLIKTNQEYKVGEWVICTKESKGYNGELGKLYQLIEIKESTLKYELANGLCTKNVGVRHATPEEINQHLISIGQIPAGEPLNTGIEPDKDGMFKYNTALRSSWSGATIQNHLDLLIPTTGNCYNKGFSTSTISVKPKMILSIDDEELPMVQIIKTNSIKQLLNND